MDANFVNHEVNGCSNLRLQIVCWQINQHLSFQQKSWHGPKSVVKMHIVCQQQFLQRINNEISLTYVLADFVCLNADVSANELQRNIDATRGFLLVFSANFCARNPPRDAPKQCIYNIKIHTNLLDYIL